MNDLNETGIIAPSAVPLPVDYPPLIPRLCKSATLIFGIIALISLISAIIFSAKVSKIRKDTSENPQTEKASKRNTTLFRASRGICIFATLMTIAALIFGLWYESMARL